MAKQVTDDTFELDVLRADGPVLVDFWAEWCGPCKQIAPSLDEISEELEGKVSLAKVNIDDYSAAIATDTEQAIAANGFGAPTFIVGGEVFWGQDRLDMLDWHLCNL